VNLLHICLLANYVKRTELTLVTRFCHYTSRIASILCWLTVAGCGSLNAGLPTRIGSAAALEASALQSSLPAHNSALLTEQISSESQDFTEITANEGLKCLGTLKEFKFTFLKLLNKARAESRQCGTTSHEPAPEVRWNEKLYLAAIRHSIDMTENDFFSHTGSDNTSVADRVDATGYPWQTVGENIAAGQTNAKEAMDGWLSSPGHCRNIMNPDYDEVAVTCVMKSPTEYTTYWTNVFGSEFE